MPVTVDNKCVELMKKYDGKRLQETLKVDEFGPNMLGHDT